MNKLINSSKDLNYEFIFVRKPSDQPSPTCNLPATEQLPENQTKPCSVVLSRREVDVCFDAKKNAYICPQITGEESRPESTISSVCKAEPSRFQRSRKRTIEQSSRAVHETVLLPELNTDAPIRIKSERCVDPISFSVKREQIDFSEDNEVSIKSEDPELPEIKTEAEDTESTQTRTEGLKDTAKSPEIKTEAESTESLEIRTETQSEAELPGIKIETEDTESSGEKEAENAESPKMDSEISINEEVIIKEDEAGYIIEPNFTLDPLPQHPNISQPVLPALLPQIEFATDPGNHACKETITEAPQLPTQDQQIGRLFPSGYSFSQIKLHCLPCKLRFVDVKTIIEHFLNYCKKDSAHIVCFICSMAFSHTLALINHLQKVHNEASTEEHFHKSHLKEHNKLVNPTVTGALWGAKLHVAIQSRDQESYANANLTVADRLDLKMSYHCDHCGILSLSLTEIAEHEDAHEIVHGGSFPCPSCKDVFHNIKRLRMHRCLEHLFCHCCQITFTNFDKFCLHETVHKGKNIHICWICCEEFELLGEFLNHRQSKHAHHQATNNDAPDTSPPFNPLSTFLCPYCNFRDNITKFSIHLMEAHNIFRCFYCESNFILTPYLPSSLGVFKCKYCKNDLVLREEYPGIKKIQKPALPDEDSMEKCMVDSCGHVTPALYNHEKKHAELQFRCLECLFCDAIMATRKSLVDHIRSHYICVHCWLGFQNLVEFEVHEFQHRCGLIYRHMCASACQWEFRHRVELHKHVLEFHHGVMPEVQITKSLKCVRLTSFLSNKVILQENNFKVQCAYCLRMVTCGTLIQHLYVMHDLRKCNNCGACLKAPAGDLTKMPCPQCLCSTSYQGYKCESVSFFKAPEARLLNKHECLKCFELFDEYSEVQIHLKTCYAVEIAVYSPHLKTARAKVISSGQILRGTKRCYTCDKVLKTKDIHQHMKQHEMLEYQDLPCLFCERKNFSRREMWTHLTDFHHLCITCNVTLPNQISLNLHYKGHENRKIVPEPCPYCPDVRFSTEQDLCNHMVQMHGNLTLSQCQKLVQTFAGPVPKFRPDFYTFKKNGGPLQCPYCGLFQPICLIRKHYSEKHQLETCRSCLQLFLKFQNCPCKSLRSIPYPKFYKCGRCSEVYFTLTELMLHLNGWCSKVHAPVFLPRTDL